MPPCVPRSSGDGSSTGPPPTAPAAPRRTGRYWVAPALRLHSIPTVWVPQCLSHGLTRLHLVQGLIERLYLGLPQDFSLIGQGQGRLNSRGYQREASTAWRPHLKSSLCHIGARVWRRSGFWTI